jgi:hypothetical protein
MPARVSPLAGLSGRLERYFNIKSKMGPIPTFGNLGAIQMQASESQNEGL